MSSHNVLTRYPRFIGHEGVVPVTSWTDFDLWVHFNQVDLSEEISKDQR